MGVMFVFICQKKSVSVSRVDCPYSDKIISHHSLVGAELLVCLNRCFLFIYLFF